MERLTFLHVSILSSTYILTMANYHRYLPPKYIVDYWSVNNFFKWDIQSLEKCPTKKFTEIGANTMDTFRDFQILANTLILKLK